MAAITVPFTSIADTAIDPNSPVTQGLMTAYRSRDQFLLEWIGASFQGGAVQNHDHDGVNSALIEVGPNLVRNGSFENNEAGWSFTDYGGGSHAQETANDMHGANSMSFTSTVLANGGGFATSAAFTACGDSEIFAFSVFLKASVANVSARLEVIWFDDAQSQISAANLVDQTNTPTSATRFSGEVTAPSTARFFKLRTTGGVPAAGSATGTIYFDGIRFNNFPLENSFVKQPHLKTTTGSVSVASSTPTNLTLPGGEYGFYPRTWRSGFNGSVTAQIASSNVVTSAVTNIALSNSTGATVDALQRYIQASPPYNLGDGDIPLFVFATVDATGKIIATYVAPDPPWANNGPTDIRADYYRAGIGYRRRRRPLDKTKLTGPDGEAYLQEWARSPLETVEITHAQKNADMGLIPHPFASETPDQAAIVLLDPVGSLCETMAELHHAGEDVTALLREQVRLDNAPVTGRKAPPGVLAVRGSWKT